MNYLGLKPISLNQNLTLIEVCVCYTNTQYKYSKNYVTMLDLFISKYLQEWPTNI